MLQHLVQKPDNLYQNLFFHRDVERILNAAQEDVAESIYYLESNRLIVDNVSLSKLQTNGHPFVL